MKDKMEKALDELGEAAQRIVINSNAGTNRKKDCDDYLKKKAALLARINKLAEKAWQYDELRK